MPIIVSTHPRTRDRLEKLNSRVKINKLVNFIKPLGIFDYINLQSNSKCVISDSGTITEESSILGFPAIMIRNAHERPEGMDQGVLIMSGLEKERVIESIEVTLKLSKIKQPVVKDYNEDNVSSKVLKIILSYIELINREVWKINMDYSKIQKELRKKILSICHKVNSGHIGCSLSCIDILIAIF